MEDELESFSPGKTDWTIEDLKTVYVNDSICLLQCTARFLDANGEKVEPGQSAHVLINSSSKLELDGTVLYHQKDENEWEKIPYVAGNDFVEFDTESFSPFIFVNEKEIKGSEEQAKDENGSKEQVETKDVSKDEEKADQSDETLTTETKKEKNEGSTKSDVDKKDGDNDVDALTGSHSAKKGVDSIILYNDAAENKDDAVDVLKDELSLSGKDAKNVASDLFSKKGTRGETEEDIPRQGDGSNIEYISAKWITGDTVTNDDDSLLYYKQQFHLQRNYQ